MLAGIAITQEELCSIGLQRLQIICWWQRRTSRHSNVHVRTHQAVLVSTSVTEIAGTAKWSLHGFLRTV